MPLARGLVAALGAIALSAPAVAHPEVREVRAAEVAFEFRVMEDHLQENVDPAIYFRVQTVQQYGCSNYRIDTELSVLDNAITVVLGEIRKPEICSTAIGPATSQVPLQIAEGTYTLTIQSGLGSDSYSLDITPDSIELTTMQSLFAFPGESVFYRFPENSFAYYCGTIAVDKHFCDDFAKLLTSHLPLEELSPAADGTWPYPAISQGAYYDMPAIFLRYPDASTWEQTRSVFEEFVRGTLQDRCGASVWLLNWRNEWLRSWMMVAPNCEGFVMPTPPPSSGVLPGTGGVPSTDGGSQGGPIMMILLAASTVAAAACALANLCMTRR